MVYFSVFPESVIDLAATSILPDAISITWVYQMNGSSPRTGAEVEVRRANMLERVVAIAPNEISTEILPLLPLITYDFTFYVVTDVGRSRPYSMNFTTISLSK